MTAPYVCRPLDNPSNRTTLRIRNLEIRLAGAARPIVHGLDLAVDRGGRRVLTGPSGSGKTTLALAILGLLPPTRFRVSGSIQLQGNELLHLSEEEIRPLRGRCMALMLQDAHAALNPLLSVGTQIGEAMVERGMADWNEARSEGLATLYDLGFEDPERVWSSRPGHLSGGMKQRVCLAMAMVLRPALLILDEPTANLDWETKKEVFDAVEYGQETTGYGTLWLTHDQDVFDRFGIPVVLGTPLLEREARER